MMPIRSAAPEAAPKAAAAEADLKNFLQKTYDADLAKSAATYESHVIASRELHEAQQHLMKTKRAMQRLESDLREAKAAAVDAIAATASARQLPMRKTASTLTFGWRAIAMASSAPPLKSLRAPSPP